MAPRYASKFSPTWCSRTHNIYTALETKETTLSSFKASAGFFPTHSDTAPKNPVARCFLHKNVGFEAWNGTKMKFDRFDDFLNDTVGSPHIAGFLRPPSDHLLHHVFSLNQEV